ncbi:MAG: polysaccharide deacetylase family protein [Balneolales bacterium]
MSIENADKCNSSLVKSQIGGKKIKVLMYHSIVEDKSASDNSRYCIHKNIFKKQLAIINKLGFSTITFDDYHSFTQGKLQLPKKPIIITFDDGYQDTYEIAFPLIKELNMKAVVFVMGDRTLATNIWDFHTRETPISRLMQDNQIKELYLKGFEIGSHSISHRNLNKLSEKEVYIELKLSKATIEYIIGKPIRSFSAPFGQLSAKIKKLIAQVGYEYNCGVFTGPPRFGQDLFEIRRIAVPNNTSIAGFIMRLITPFEYLEWMRWKIRTKLNSVVLHTDKIKEEKV